MKCIVIDDEPLAREGIEILMKNFNSLFLIGSFSNIIEADTFINKNQTDLIFLDINMPGISGIEFLKNKYSRPMVIITTAYSEYAIEGFDLDVVDYLIKPIRIERFYKAISKCQNLYNIKNQNQNKDELIKKEIDYLFVRSDRKYVKLQINLISHIEALKDYVIIYHNNEKHLIAINLKSIENKLSSDIFLRVNKSIIVNKDFIISIETDIINICNLQISIGEKYKEDVYKILLDGKLIKRDY